jgi:hypothetical protein
MRHLSLLRFGVALSVIATAVSAHAAMLTSSDFNDRNPWKISSTSSSAAIKTAAQWKPVGTIDQANTDTSSGGLLLTVDASSAKGAWDATLVSSALAVKNTETNLGKLTLGFMLSVSAVRPVNVTIESVNKAGKASGALTAMVYPAAADFYQRYSLDLSTLKPTGKGQFNPTDAAIRVRFAMVNAQDDLAWPAGKHELRLDNLSYATPALYVSAANGNDSNDGRSEKTALATPQAALNAAQAGDIIVIRKGTYNGGDKPAASFVRPGTPAAWIVLKNYPGELPMLTGNGWQIVNVQLGSKEQHDTTGTLAYFEIRGLHMRGEADLIEKKFPETIGQSDPRSNTNCLSVDGRYMKNVPHHIRIADNIAEYCPALGIGLNEADRFVIENNIARYNSWQTIYGTSGFSTLGASNFDTADNVYKILVRNNTAYRNETYVICKNDKKMTDGNGIIIDVNQNTAPRKHLRYIGRTLVTGNLVYDNGGGGIHTVRTHRVDIIHNTAYLNSASSALQYSQIDASWGSKDVRIMNNIMVAPVANVAAGEKPEPVNDTPGGVENVVFSNNLYFGGNLPPNMGEGDKVADPKFVNPSRDPKIADFRLRDDSPARGVGAKFIALPILDLDGRARPSDKPYDLGALQSSK